MRRFVAPVAWPLLRTAVVGPSTTIPRTSPTPDFGRRRRRLARRAEKQIFLQENDEDAKNACFERYGFVQKPLFMETWQEFLKELQRVELSWSLAPGANGTLHLKVYDHFEPGDGLLCELPGSTSRSAAIAEFFEACGSITQGGAAEADIHFLDGGKHSVLQIASKKCFVNSDIKDEPPILPFKYISLQTLNYAFMTSLPIFLKRPDIGVRNADFVTKDQMRHFRFAWCFLRKESWMTPVEMAELDTLLPP